jgi:cell wall assembly regulator SMI1
MQKFTRPITREIELGGERLALTLTEAGVSIRPVGSRRPPLELSWAALLGHLTSGHASEPSAEQLSAAVQAVKGGGRSSRSSSAGAPGATAAPPTPPAPAAGPAGGGQPTAPASSDLAGVLARLEHWLAAHRHNFVRGLKPGATADDLRQLQERLGTSLSDDLRVLLSWHNGQDDEKTGCFRESWFLMGSEEIARTYQEVTGGGGAGGWQRSWVPILDDDRGNYVFLDTSQAGPPVREFWEGSTEQRTVAPSLAAWLRDFVAAVERGEYAEDPERGRFLRQTSPKP